MMENYDKLKEIGKGSYGVVWLVKSKKDKKNFVLKRIDLRKSPERDKKSAQQEAQLLKNLKHPNIVSYKESFHCEGYLHIVMLYCDGGDLYTKIKEQNGKFLEETQIVEWFVQIAMALQYMHEQNILHRDLKTQNIFLTKNKIIKVGDLGIARVLKSNNDMATTIIGTPYYMSPELFSNKPYNSKSDVWALGCCVYEMTTLKHAFNAKDMTSLVLKITRGKMPTIPQHYSRDFISLIEAMLNADPKKRPSVSRILRDQFIKKNIMLFLERTKLKQLQAQQFEKENKFAPHPPSSLENKPQVAGVTPRHRNIVDYRDLRPKSAQELHPNNKASPELNIQDSSPQRSVSSQGNCEQSNKKPSKPRVRISSVVENIETKEYFKLESQSVTDLNEVDNNFNDTSDDEDIPTQTPYQLTKPMQNAAIYNEHRNSVEERLSQKKNAEVFTQHRPKIIDKSNQPLPRENRSVNSSPSTNLNARERRRQKLRLSQNESSSNDLKPPILRRLEAKSQKSEIFYNSSDSKQTDKKASYNNKQVSKSCNDMDNEKNRPLVDSLKIFRNINPMSGGAQQRVQQQSKSSNLLNKKQNAMDRDPYYPKKQLTNSSSQSSSSSSIASSNEDDPGMEMVRMEKRKKKDFKEIETFIGHLNSTLNAANLLRCDSDMDDIKDEVLEDLEEEAIQAEFEEKDNSFRENKNRASGESFDYRSPISQPRKSALPFSSSSYSNDEENESGSDNVESSNRTIRNSGKENVSELTINNLGATNHMHNRINQLEKEFIQLIGREKLEEAFRILDSFKEEEIKVKLIRLMGESLYEANSGKLWLLKFCKDTAKISVR